MWEQLLGQVVVGGMALVGVCGRAVVVVVSMGDVCGAVSDWVECCRV